ncbi:hypothetical protein [Nocardiopsis potens]|uniref:hypothetical protein n=1 Tax=Nocardiopsis potens TaxID=1246458 RepID=UPI00034D81D8|nr:hypothetical protein [Nocardiopsis potens]
MRRLSWRRPRSRVRRYTRPAPAAAVAGRWPVIRAGYGSPLPLRPLFTPPTVPA